MGKDQDLLDAARTGNVVTIQKILSARPKNALSQAIAIGFRRSVAPNCQDSSGYSPLHHAVLNNHKLAVDVLLKHDASPGLPDAKGSTPFHLAAWTGGTEIIRVLMSHAKSYSQVNEQNNDWDTPLHFAAQYGHTDVVKILLENGADPTIFNKKEETPLDLAAQYGRLETVELLLRRQPELLNRIPERRSILHLSARNGHPLVMKALLDAGCDINKKLNTGSALHEAALFGKVEAVRVLLEHTPPINIHIKDMTGETALQKVEGYPSKVAIDIAAMIKAHIKGDPLPPSSATPGQRRKAKDPIDAEQKSTYDNVPPATPPTVAVLRHSAYTPPLVKKPARHARPTTGAVNNKSTNYMNLDLPTKVPPKKPARSSIGILLDKVDLSSSPRSESPLVNSSSSMFEISSVQRSSNSPATKLPSPEKSPPPLPDRNYYDEDVAGEYTQLRPSATKTSNNASPSVPIKTPMSSFKCSAPPSFIPPAPGVQMRGGSSKHRHVYEPGPTDDAPVISSKEDVNEVRRSLLLRDHAPVSAPVSAPVLSSSPDSESFYEDLSEAYSGEIVSSKHIQEPSVHTQHLQATIYSHGTMDSSTGSDVDADVYELLSDATTGRNGNYENYDNYDVPPPRMALSSVDSALQELSPTRDDMPVPPPRRTKQHSCNSRCSTPTIPPPPTNDINGGLPVSATNSYYSEFRSSGTEDSDLPSSPGSYYSQPPTPDHPPPSPHTAKLGIQAKLSPQSFSHGIFLGGNEEPNEAWTSQQSSPEYRSACEAIKSRDSKIYSEQTASRHYQPDSPPHYSTGDNYSSANPTSRCITSREHCNENIPPIRRQNQPEKPTRFGFPSTNISSSQNSDIHVPKALPSSDQELLLDAQQTDAHGCQDGAPVNNSHHFNQEPTVQLRDLDNYRGNDDFLSITDTSSSGDTDLLRPDDEDPFAGLIYGSNRGSRNLSLETTSRFSLSQHMADWSLAGSSRTSMIGENGLVDAPPDGGGGVGHGGGAEENAGIDENSEWAQIESIMASFGAGLVRESVYIRDFQKEFEKMFEGPGKPQSIGAWLENLGMGQYENMLIANGFDNLDFMGGQILEEGDLIEMGIMEDLHRKIILQSTNALPVMKTINHVGNMPSSVSEWLRSLLLSDCIPNFIDNGITSMERAKELWEVELENVLEVHMLGHRKRILASLGDRRHSFASSNSSLPRPTSLELTTDDLELKLSSFERRKQLSSTASEQSASLDIDLFKDYSKEVTTPTKAAAPIKPKHLPHLATQEEQPNTQTEQEVSRSSSAATRSSDIEHYDNMPVSDRASNKDRASNSEEIDNGPTSPAVQWMHPPEALIKGCCNYTASYLGSTLIKEIKCVDSTQESCTKLRRSASHLQKIPSITLSISYMGVKFIDFKSKMIITEHEICNISCVTQDSDDHRTFAYITKDSENEKLYCHVFSVKAEDIATEIILTLGQAFEIAYQMLLKSRPVSNEHTRQLSNTSENDHDTKL